MRVALLFSGQPRYINECYQSIKENLIDPNIAAGHSIDIFAHFWWSSKYIGKSFKFHAADVYERDELENFKSKYQPRNVFSEQQEKFDISGYDMVNCEHASYFSDYNRELWSKEVTFKQISMWESVSRSYIALEESSNPLNYDIIIRLRTDLVFTKPILFSDIEIPSDGVAIDDFENKSQLCDWFALGNSKFMSNYCNLNKFKHKDLSESKVIISTTLMRRNSEFYKQKLNVRDFGVNIYRGYKAPLSMQDHEQGDARPYWMEKT